jgi:cell division protein FtsB
LQVFSTISGGERRLFPSSNFTQQITQQAEINEELKERNRILAAEVLT